MTSQEIISKLPYQFPFLFVDDILSVDDNAITGSYTYDPELPFYEGHFKNHPVTPGVILTETMAQIGLVAFGIYLMRDKETDGANDGLPWDKTQIAFTFAEMNFYKPVLPKEKVIVKGIKEYFRFNKLKCAVDMYNEKQELVCRGVLAGMIKTEK